MKTKNFFLSLFAIAFIFTAAAWAMDSPTETICHKGTTIKVHKTALNVHLAHGDTIGACD